MSTLSAAQAARARGWHVVPIPPREKKPVLNEWQRLRLTDKQLPEYFSEGGNIGLLLGVSNGVVDLDLDQPEAIMLADTYAPKTNLVSGRKSKPFSHRWFHCPLISRVTQFKDLDNQVVLVELRGGSDENGAQTVIPPSIHKSGESYVWHSEGEPANVDGDDLLRRVRLIAAGALLARHWPAQGSRHQASLALAGMLLRSGWSEEDADAFILAVAEAANDEEARSRRSDVRTTAREIEAKKPVTGAPELAKIIGGACVERVREWLELARVTAKERPRLIVWTSTEFLAQTFPPREPYVVIGDTPIFTSQSLNQIFAKRGTGKSMLALTLAGILATGGEFLTFKIPKARNVMYVDGELPRIQLQQRMRLLQTPNALLRLIDLDSQGVFGIPSLATREGQQFLEQELDCVDVLFLDSIATLAQFQTNEEEPWNFFNNWLMRLRSMGKCVITLHQAGIQGRQRARSNNDDPLDVQIKLEGPEDEETDHLKCRLLWTKFRGPRQGVKALNLEFANGGWTYSHTEDDRLKILEEYLALPGHAQHPSRMIARELPELGSHTTINKLRKLLEQKK